MNKWTPIQDLSEEHRHHKHDNLHSLADIWSNQKDKLKKSNVLKHFEERLRRSAAIETGVIENLYTIEHGVTRILIEQGIEASLIPHGSTDKPAMQVVAIIRDHEQAIEWVMDYVGNQRQLTISFIKEVHQLLTRNQDTTEAIDQFGKIGETPLIKGNWKKFPNNPTRQDGSIHEYCPPEQVSVQMEQLVEWHLEHMQQNVSPEVEAAWLHHRFTQIHPFQDGNGRVARLLATLVFLRAGWFPLIVINGAKDQNQARGAYIKALELADHGDLMSLVELFADSQNRSFLKSLSLSERVLSEVQSVDVLIGSIIETLQMTQTEAVRQVENYATQLFDIAETKLEDLKTKIEIAINQSTHINQSVTLQLTHALEDDERASYYRYQIIEVAQEFEYFANFQNYKRWLRLLIQIDSLGTRTEILLAFHHLGRKPEGVMMCTAIGFRRYPDAMEESRDIEALSLQPFNFTHHDNEERMKQRFENWLTDFVPIALRYWQNSLT